MGLSGAPVPGLRARCARVPARARCSEKRFRCARPLPRGVVEGGLHLAHPESALPEIRTPGGKIFGKIFPRLGPGFTLAQILKLVYYCDWFRAEPVAVVNQCCTYSGAPSLLRPNRGAVSPGWGSRGVPGPPFRLAQRVFRRHNFRDLHYFAEISVLK